MILQAEKISKRYYRNTKNANTFLAVQEASMFLAPSTVTVLMGRSGSGKTTLLNMLAGLLKPTEGRITLDDTDLYSMRDVELSRCRNTHIGVIPQGRSSVDTLDVLENVLLPGVLYGKADASKALNWLEKLGIGHLRHTRTNELSGGELRRMAIARTLYRDTDIILADEPTGDLDDENTRLVLKLLREEAVKQGKSVLIVSHESLVVEYADAVCTMTAGVLTSGH